VELNGRDWTVDLAFRAIMECEGSPANPYTLEVKLNRVVATTVAENFIVRLYIFCVILHKENILSFRLENCMT
jgi:hypothetical protein